MTKLYKTYNEKFHKVYYIYGLKLKIKSKNLEIFNYIKFNSKIKDFKFVHIMNNGIHSINIINFINKYFNNKEHCFIFPGEMFFETQNKLKGISNIFHCSLKSIDFNSVNKIIVHGLFDSVLVKELYKYKKLLEKTYWFIWGGDLYSAPESKKDDFVRKNIAGILTSFDEEIYKKKYNKNIKCFDVTYPHEINEEMIIKNLKKNNEVHVQINNSADITTLEMLDILSRFKNENIKISTILSYITVKQEDSRTQIIKKGYEIFGTKFNPITKFIPKEQYAQHLASVDIYISNQNRQQGNGNATFIHSLGGKIFLKSDTSIYKKYNSIGIKIFDTYEIKNMDFKEFCSFDESEKQKSISILKERMKDETKVKQWGDFFNA